jgi:signal transduction histidine kinase
MAVKLVNAKVLIIEDDSDARSNIGDILELDGYRADMAGTVREALGRTNWDEYAAILLDRRLPDGTAEDLIPRLKQRAPHAALLILTGYGDIDSAISALRYGVADYILKPIHAAALRASLDRIRRLRESEARAQQAERLAAIGQVVTVFSHESRNALNQIALCLGVLQRRLEGQSDLLGHTALAEKALNQVLRLFEDLRGYSAPIALHQDECRLPAVVRQAWDSLNAAWRKRDVRFREEGLAQDLCCQADPFRMEQAFRNIFENALAACTDPVELNMRYSETELEGQPALRVAIRDNGPGLSPEQKGKVFEPFYTTKNAGTGLGMAITKRIVEAHGGYIAVGERHPVGAEFIIWLPRAAR